MASSRASMRKQCLRLALQHHSMEKHCPRQWLSLTQDYQHETTMPRNEEEISRDEHIDQKVLVGYIKNDLFQRAKFV